MKKQIVFALAALSMVVQAHAVTGRGAARPTETTVRDNRVDSRTETRDSRTSGAASAEARELRTALDAKLPRLSPEKSRLMDELLADPKAEDLREVLSKVANNSSSELADLNAAIVDGVLKIKNVDREVNTAQDALNALDPDVRAGKSLVSLVTKAGLEASGWSAETRGTLVALLKSVNAKITPGMTQAQQGKALRAAAAEVEAQLKIKINIDEIVARCK